jgi:hypothetical protein
MKRTRAIAVVLLAFLFGGTSAELAVQAKRVLSERRAPPEDEGAAGELVALELRDGDGVLLARPGRAAQLELVDPDHPWRVRVALRVETARDPSGDVVVGYELALPTMGFAAAGTAVVASGVEAPLELGGGAVTATLFSVPVPSAAFEAYLASERALVRSAGLRDRS